MGVFLRLGESSTERAVEEHVSDGRIGLDGGRSRGTSVTLAYKDWNVHLRHKGTYPIDAEPPRSRVRQGVAEARPGAKGTDIRGTGNGSALAASVPGKLLHGGSWTRAHRLGQGRSESISADNAITAQIEDHPATRDPGLGTDMIAISHWRLLTWTVLSRGSTRTAGSQAGLSFLG